MPATVAVVDAHRHLQEHGTCQSSHGRAAGRRVVACFTLTAVAHNTGLTIANLADQALSLIDRCGSGSHGVDPSFVVESLHFLDRCCTRQPTCKATNVNYALAKVTPSCGLQPPPFAVRFGCKVVARSRAQIDTWTARLPAMVWSGDALPLAEALTTYLSSRRCAPSLMAAGV